MLKHSLKAAFLAYARSGNHPAKLRIIDWIARLVIPTRGFTTQIAAGFQMRLHLYDHLERCLVFRDHYEQLTSKFVSANTQPGMCCVVAGANLGYYPLLISQKLSGQGCVLGIEPFPETLRRCRENLQLNPSLQKNIQLFAGALGESSKSGYVTIPPREHSGIAQVSESSQNALPIEIRPLGLLLREHELPKPDLMVLDVEGTEFEVLNGLGTDIPKLLLVENDPGNQIAHGHSETELFERLRQLGYSLAHLDGHEANPGDFFPEQTLVAYQHDLTPVWIQ